MKDFNDIINLIPKDVELLLPRPEITYENDIELKDGRKIKPIFDPIPVYSGALGQGGNPNIAEGYRMEYSANFTDVILYNEDYEEIELTPFEKEVIITVLQVNCQINETSEV